MREGDALERLALVSGITFDKTGTLTCGAPEVMAVISCDPAMDSEKLYGCWQERSSARSIAGKSGGKLLQKGKGI